MLPTGTKEVALFYAAPATTSEMTLRFYGLENYEAVPGVWLVDRYLDNKVVKINSDTEYHLLQKEPTIRIMKSIIALFFAFLMHLRTDR